MKSGFQCDEGVYGSSESVEEGERRVRQSVLGCVTLKSRGFLYSTRDDSGMSRAI